MSAQPSVQDTQAEEGVDEEAPNAAVSHVGSSMSLRRARMESKSQLVVDKDVLRGIRLSRTLRRLGALWLTSPADLKESARGLLWEQSQPVESLDRFLSHTWWTSGRLKLLALLLQNGWPFMLLCYVLAAAAAASLVLLGVLPLPFQRFVTVGDIDVQVNWAPWTLLFTAAATVLGLFASPYVPWRVDPVCFLDVVSIHQVDLDLQKRGVYGLGGFLAASKEMHILWSAPYLSRLWCVYELAAFRKANPSGRIVVRPLFVELQALCYMLGAVFCATITFAWLSTGLLYSAAYIVVYVVASSPFLFISHRNRLYMREKDTLISDLQHFSLSNVQSRLEKDREFIYESINDWYGSEEAFTEHVRGPLKKELLASTADLPVQYSFLMVLPFFSVSLDALLGCSLAGVSVMDLLPRFFANDIGWAVLWFLLGTKLTWRLTEIFSAQRSCRAMDYATTCFIYFAGYVCWSFVGGEVVVLVWAGLWPSVAWAAFLIVMIYLQYRSGLCDGVSCRM